MNLRIAVCIGFASQFLAGATLAQPALERVEQQLRKQVPARTANTGDAAAADDAAAENKNAGYLGILGDDRGENAKGVRVTKTDAGGPAAKGGMKNGDLITSIDDQPVKSMDDMGEIMAGQHAGALLKISVDRDGETRELQIRLERRPPADKRLAPQFGKQAEEMPAPGSPVPGGPAPGDPATGGPALGPSGPGDSVILNTRRPKLGIRTVHLSTFIREQTRLPGSYVAGVFVTFVDPDSPAGKGGLPNNSIITAVDGEPIDSPDTLAALVHRAGPGQVLNVTYYFHDHETQTAITLAGGPPQSASPAPQPTVRAKPIPWKAEPPVQPPTQPPGFAPEVDDAGEPMPPAANVGALERRIAELEKRVAELESQRPSIVPADDK